MEAIIDHTLRSALEKLLSLVWRQAKLIRNIVTNIRNTNLLLGSSL